MENQEAQNQAERGIVARAFDVALRAMEEGRWNDVTALQFVTQAENGTVSEADVRFFERAWA